MSGENPDRDRFINPNLPPNSPPKGETWEFKDVLKGMQDLENANKEGNENLDTDVPQHIEINYSKKDTGILNEEALNQKLEEGKNLDDIFPLPVEKKKVS